MLKWIEVLIVFTRLGLSSFGGPVAHLGFFHNEFVKKREWISESTYADLVALCQFLPGPASSQVGMAIGLSRSGILGALAAWVGFTLPSALLMVFFAIGLTSMDFVDHPGIHGLKVVAVAVVAQALWAMRKSNCPDLKRLGIAGLSAFLALQSGNVLVQMAILMGGGALGLLLLRGTTKVTSLRLCFKVTRWQGGLFLAVFLGLLIILPLVSEWSSSNSLKLFDRLFRSGSLVFGGGHVVLPILQAEVVSSGWVTESHLMAGYGLAQALPGPLFSFSAYIGAVASISPSIWGGAGICLVAIFLPSFLLVIGVLPFWEKLRHQQEVRFAMLGINSAVVGLLLSAFIYPVWSSAIHDLKDIFAAAVCFALLNFWKWPAWLVVALGSLSYSLF